jgi:RNA polymerase sigma factor for flagellar operon FliA
MAGKTARRQVQRQRKVAQAARPGRGKSFPSNGKSSRSATGLDKVEQPGAQLALDFPVQPVTPKLKSYSDATSADQTLEDGSLSTAGNKFLIEGKYLTCEDLVHQHLGMVKSIVSHMRVTLPAHVELDDLIQEGVLGLFDAAAKFDDSLKWRFSTYAKPRIFGAITDFLRSVDWAPRTVRTRKRSLETAVHELESELKRTPTKDEIAQRMGVSLEELADTYARVQRSTVVSLEEALPGDDDDDSRTREKSLVDTTGDFTKGIENQELKRFFRRVIDELPKQERTVFTLHYTDCMTLKAISKILDLSESRVSQLRISAVRQLQERFMAERDELGLHGVDLSMIGMDESKPTPRAGVSAA